jgi:replicative DNA helicase
MSLQAQFITRCIQLGSIKKFEHLARAEFFDPHHLKVYEIIADYERQYGKCIDEATFRDAYDSVWMPTDLQPEYIADDMAQTFIEAAATKILEDGLEAIADNPRNVNQLLIKSLRDLHLKYGILQSPLDIIEAGAARIEALRKREILDGLSGITLGFEMLDEVTCGTQAGDIEFWVARPGNGKTFLLLYGAKRGYDQGKRISFVSPEMPAQEIGLRLDAMMYGVSQMSMMSGKASIQEYDDYYQAFTDRKHTGGAFFFRDAFTLGRRFTVDDLPRIIEQDRPDILIVDGLLHIEPTKETRTERERVMAVVQELRNITVETQVPMRIAHQANRLADQNTSGKRKKDTSAADFIPELVNLAEAAATEQWANRVICHKFDAETAPRTMYMAVRKNRSGPEGLVIQVPINVDRGEVGIEKTADAVEEQSGVDDEMQLGANF